jgi:hypothetical protein
VQHGARYPSTLDDSRLKLFFRSVELKSTPETKKNEIASKFEEIGSKLSDDDYLRKNHSLRKNSEKLFIPHTKARWGPWG